MTDAEQEMFELICGLHGFPLATWDAWYAEQDDGPAMRQLAEYRAHAFAAARANNEEALRLALQLLRVQSRALARSDFLLPQAKRDVRRQAGTRKPRLPEIDTWIARELKRKPAAKCPELWSRAPEEVTDKIGCHAFGKRVTKARKVRCK